MEHRPAQSSECVMNSRISAIASSYSDVPGACRQTFGFSVQKLTKLKCIGRRRAFLVVVEINEYVAALPFPGSDVSGPVVEDSGAIMAFVAAARSMSSDIDKIGGALPGGRRIVMVRQAERYVVFGQQPQNARIIPAGMPKFETVTALARKQFEEGGQADPDRREDEAVTETGRDRPFRAAGITGLQEV